MTPEEELELLKDQLLHGDARLQGEAADRLAELNLKADPEWVVSVHDKLWNKVCEVGGDLMELSGTDPRNNVPSATLKVKGGSAIVPTMMGCRETMVGVTLETAGLRFAFYVDTNSYKLEGPAYTSTANLLGIWDVLSYLQIWPMWYMPIQAQPISHAVFFGPLVTVVENMIAECALRMQSGLWEAVNNALSLNPDLRAWFGTLLQSNGNLKTMLKTPVYVVRTNPFLDTSPMVVKTVRMQSCATVIKELTAPYGVVVNVDLWLPGDPQPDRWANLTQPTYVVTVTDRSQIEGPTKTILDSVLRTVVDLGGSLGSMFAPIIKQVAGMSGVYESPALGIDFVPPYAVLVAPEGPEIGASAIKDLEIVDHTPRGWQLMIGGKSPKALNDIINALFSWLIDSIMILIGFTGVPSNLLSGFLNDAFFAFQIVELYDRRDDVGPYHPAKEVFKATGASPYNIEAAFTFINLAFETRGYTSAKVTFRNGEYRLGRDVFRGGLFMLIYYQRTRMLIDYIENIMFRLTPSERDLMLQIGDGKAEEPPLAKHQRNFTGSMESINVLTLAPQG